MLLLSLYWCFPLVASRLLHSLPQDPYALPKYRVTFLNGLPVLNETAQAWLKHGLRGGEREFLDQPWKDLNIPSSPKGISSGADQEAQDNLNPLSYHSLEYMKMGPKDSYLCLIPLPLDQPAQSPDDPQADLNPVQSWSLLHPLSGTCLYHRQGWFTYSYCHNEEIRQFRELPHAHPHPHGYVPEEDHDWEAYTLGRAPPPPVPGVDLTVAQQQALAANLELARGAGSRYLVQRWGDGTVCDRTGKSREVEVQFHCSPTMMDHILFVKEAKTCSYVLVIHTPRLCGQPGFKSGVDAAEAALIKCREIVGSVNDLKSKQAALPETDGPVKQAPPNAGGTPLNDPLNENKDKGENKGKVDGEDAAPQRGKPNEVLRALGAFMGDPSRLILQVTDDGDLLIDFTEDLALGRKADDPLVSTTADVIAEALRAAGYEVKGSTATLKKEQQSPNGAEEEPEAKRNRESKGTDRHHRDEL